MATNHAITGSLRKAIGLAPSSADAQALLAEIMDVWGGPKELARCIKESYDSAEPGSMIRQRYMEMVQRLIINNTKEELVKDVDPSEMSDDELFDAAKVIIKRMKEDGEDIDDVPEGSTESTGDDSADLDVADFFGWGAKPAD